MKTTKMINPLNKEELANFSNSQLTAEQLSEVKGGSAFGLAVCCIANAKAKVEAE